MFTTVVLADMTTMILVSAWFIPTIARGAMQYVVSVQTDVQSFDRIQVKSSYTYIFGTRYTIGIYKCGLNDVTTCAWIHKNVP